MHRTLGFILQHAGVHHMVEPPHFCLERDEALVLRHDSRLTKLVDILLYAWHGDRHSYVHLVDVPFARMGWKDGTSSFLCDARQE